MRTAPSVNKWDFSNGSCVGASKKGIIRTLHTTHFKPKLKTTPKKVIFLTCGKLNKLKDYQIPHDKAVFGNVSGMSFCSVASRAYDIRMFVTLTRSDIKPDHMKSPTGQDYGQPDNRTNDHSKAILAKNTRMFISRTT